MRKLQIILLLIFSIAVSTCSSDSRSEAEEKKASSSTKIDKKNNKEAVWLSFDEGLARSKAENKNMIVDFYTDWCHWCKVMDEKTFKEEKVNAKLADRFITVRLNAEDKTKTATYKGKTHTNVELTRTFGVRGFPSLAFMDPNGEVITLIPGYVPAETFLYFLSFIDTECYKKQMSFDEYMKKKGDCIDKTVKN